MINRLDYVVQGCLNSTENPKNQNVLLHDDVFAYENTRTCIRPGNWKNVCQSPVKRV